MNILNFIFINRGCTILNPTKINITIFCPCSYEFVSLSKVHVIKLLRCCSVFSFTVTQCLIEIMFLKFYKMCCVNVYEGQKVPICSTLFFPIVLYICIKCINPIRRLPIL